MTIVQNSFCFKNKYKKDKEFRYIYYNKSSLIISSIRNAYKVRQK